MNRIVIIGAGLSGVKLAESMLGSGVEITLISAEAYWPYNVSLRLDILTG